MFLMKNLACNQLTYQGLNNMANIFQITFSNAFFESKYSYFDLNFIAFSS